MDHIDMKVRDRLGDTPLEHVIGTRYTDALKVLRGDSRVDSSDVSSEEEDDPNDMSSSEDWR